MNKQTCPNCGCANWQEAKSCIRCKTSLSFQNQTPKNRVNNNFAQTNDSAAIKPDANKIPSGLVAVVLLAVFVIGGYVYLEKFSVDEFTKISSFDQLYNGITLPDQTMMKKQIEELNTSNRNVDLTTGMFNTTKQICPENTPQNAFNQGCVFEKETITQSSFGAANFKPTVNSFKITSAELQKSSDGRITYKAKYTAILKGGYYDNNLVNAKSDAMNAQDSVENAVSGNFFLNWNDTAKNWEAPQNMFKSK